MAAAIPPQRRIRKPLHRILLRCRIPAPRFCAGPFRAGWRPASRRWCSSFCWPASGWRPASRRRCASFCWSTSGWWPASRRGTTHSAGRGPNPNIAAPGNRPGHGPQNAAQAERAAHAPQGNFAGQHPGAPATNHFNANAANGHFNERAGQECCKSSEPKWRSGPTGPLCSRERKAIDPRHFADRRRLVSDPVFRPFLARGWHDWHGHNHLGWVGPLFWPYAYGDFFYYALWPDEYQSYDPVWAYGYGDVYQALFPPYTYDQYVGGSGASTRMTELTRSVAQSCVDEAAEVTRWPINDIADAVQPDQQQSALLDDLGNAIVQASDVIKAHCPTSVAFTPTGRLDDMHERLDGFVQAVNIVLPPLTKFYNSLSDDQKARFNSIGTNQGGRAPQTANDPTAECGANIMAWPNEQIDRIVRPDDAQRARLAALQSAAAQAADMIRAACPREIPATPPGRLEAVGNRLRAMLQAVETIQPALTDFYAALNDDQKARFNTMGAQLFAQNR